MAIFRSDMTMKRPEWGRKGGRFYVRAGAKASLGDRPENKALVRRNIATTHPHTPESLVTLGKQFRQCLTGHNGCKFFVALLCSASYKEV